MSENRFLIRKRMPYFQMLTSRKGYSKVPVVAQEVIKSWVRNHHFVVYSPNNNDTLKVKVLDMEDGVMKVVLKNKIILQCSIRELYNDLYSPGIGLVGPNVEYSVIGEGGQRMVSDTVFRSLLPQELRLSLIHI